MKGRINIVNKLNVKGKVTLGVKVNEILKRTTASKYYHTATVPYSQNSRLNPNYSGKLPGEYLTTGGSLVKNR